MMALILQQTDPVNAIMLIVLWLRIERFAKRVNRLESEIIELEK
jgi:hypothetical protein